MKKMNLQTKSQHSNY